MERCSHAALLLPGVLRLGGKTLIPFCTSGGSGFGRSLDNLPASAPSATILEGFHVNGSSVDGAAEDVAAWLSGLGL